MRRILMIMAVVFISCSVGWADMVAFTTPGGSTDTAGDPVSAQAVVTTGNGTVTIALSNLQDNFKDAGQLLSDFSVDLSDSSTATPTVTSTGNQVIIEGDGSVKPGLPADSGWNFASAAGVPSGETISLDGLNGAVNTPGFLVIGPPCSDGTYCKANGSIAGNGPHNPFLQNTLTFTISGFTGITSSTSASNAVFSFGTTSGDDVPGTVTPEPASLLLFGTGLLGLAYFVRRREKRGAVEL